MKFPWQKSSVDQSTLPKEIQSYYTANQPRRNGTAWLLAIVTLIITLLILAGLFFAGRWAIQKLTSDGDGDGDNGTQTTNQPQSETDPTPQSTPTNPTPPPANPTPTPPSNQPTPAPAPPQNQPPTPPPAIVNTGPSE